MGDLTIVVLPFFHLQVHIDGHDLKARDNVHSDKKTTMKLTANDGWLRHRHMLNVR